MSDNILPVKLQLRYDTYNNWSVSPIILLPGEIGIAVFPSVNSTDPPRAFGVKVGDGRHYYDELPWIQAIASDVYNWAKQINKPTYNASEIEGLAEYILSHTSGGGSGGSGGTIAGGTYRILYNSVASKYTLQYYNSTDEEWVNATGDEINLSNILNSISTIERWANGAKTNLGNIEFPITAIVYDEIVTYLNRLNVEDIATEHQFVTAVEQIDGKIRITRSILNASDITSGTLSTAHGGTGLSSVENNEILVGSVNGDITTRTFVTEIDVNDRSSFATVGAIIDYITQMTAGLTGAMHFIGETSMLINATNNRSDPHISGYNFRNAQPGDVILANNSQEYVWTGSEWRLLGDEGSYAIKGSIVNADISDGAAISQEKIDGLAEVLNTKVDKIEGKGLSTNDYTTEEKNKLRDIQDNAQENIIEHILVNDIEVSPQTISGQPKSVNLLIPVLSEDDINKLESIEVGAQENIIEHIFVNGTEISPSVINEIPKSIGINFIPFTQEEQDKLKDIEPEAQVNTVEEITINNVSYTPDANKNIDITIDFAALKSNTEDYWNNHPIIPGAGELIIYTVDGNHAYPRIKVGDGVTVVTSLPFIDAGTINGSSLAILSYENSTLFPAQGTNGTLYIDLSTSIIYYYTNNNYMQLSNFYEKTPVSNITTWLTGQKPSFVCEGGRLKISTGILPTLLWETPYVIRNITKEVAGE